MRNLNSVKIGGYMAYQGGTSDRLWSTANDTNDTHPTPGRKDIQMW